LSGMSDVGFLFDLDGVLVDSHELHWSSWQLLQQEDASFKMSLEQFKEGFGQRNESILRKVAPHATTKHEQWAERKEALYRQIASEHLVLLPGMAAFLQQVVEQKIPHIIASSTPVANLNMLLQKTEVGHYFQEFVSGEQVAHGKPAPDVFLAAAAQLGKEPRNCIVFEDAPVGIAAGKAAGCFVVALATTHPADQLKGYDLLVSSPLDLDVQLILQKSGKLV